MSAIFFQLHESCIKTPSKAIIIDDSSSFFQEGSYAKWKPVFPVSGFYKVLLRWPADEKGSSTILYKIHHQGNVTQMSRNQQTNHGSWTYLGRYYFDEGHSENNKLILEAASAKDFTIADAVWFILDNDGDLHKKENKINSQLVKN